MPTVLHVIEGASPQATPATLALIAATIRHVRGVDHHLLLLGGTALQRMADHAAIAGSTRLGVPRQRAAMGLLSIRRWINQTYPQGPDLIHAWSCGIGRVAATIRPQTPRLLSLTQAPDDAATDTIRSHIIGAGRAPVGVTVLNQAMRGGLTAQGVDGSRITVIPPAIDTAMLDAGRRASLRESWPMSTADTRVFALLSDPPTAADARKANLGIGLAHESLLAALGRPAAVRLLMHPNQLHRLSAYRLLVNYGVAELIVQEPRLAAPWQVLPACDAALIPAEHAGGLATAWAMAAGVAIVCETPSPADDLLRNEENALLADRDQPKRLAHRLHQLIHEPALARRIADQARRDAQGLFAPALYADRISGLYRAMLGNDNLSRARTDPWAGAEQAAAPGTV